MKHLFVPYELALLAKEKGFIEECIYYYDSSKEICSGTPTNWNKSIDLISAPSVDQLKKFLRVNLIHIKEMPASNGMRFTSWDFCIMKNERNQPSHIKYIQLEGSVEYEPGIIHALTEAFKLI